MMYTAYRLNKQGNNIELWHTYFLISLFFISSWSFLNISCIFSVHASLLLINYIFEVLKHLYYHYSGFFFFFQILVFFSHSVIADCLWSHGLQYSSLPCPSPLQGACSNSCPLNWWCHPTTSSSVIPFSHCLQSFPESGSFQWVSSSHQVSKILEPQLQHQSF